MPQLFDDIGSGPDTFAGVMALEPHGTDVYLGESPIYPWGRVYGGLVVAQALRAACLTVDPAYRAHSLHGYFIRGGATDEPIRYEVDRIRNGRSFLTRCVVARQSGGAIFNLSCSFQVEEDQADVQTAQLPDGVPLPADLPSLSWSYALERKMVPPEAIDGRFGVWLRVSLPVGETDAVVDQCAVAYATDDGPTEAAIAFHPAGGDARDGRFMSASLDHSVWLHRPSRSGEWHLHLLECHGLSGGRGLATGHVFRPDGVHVASISQQVLLRRLKA